MFTTQVYVPNETEQTLKTLHESQFLFQLTGSRWFDENNVSDWDFFVQDDADIFHFLQDNGFSQIETKYNDKSVCCVYHKDCKPFPIDVQIVNNFHLKKKANNLLKITGFSSNLKSQRKQIWNAVLTFLSQ